MLTIKLGGRPMTAKQARDSFCPLLLQTQPVWYKCHAESCVCWMWVDEIPTGSVPNSDIAELLDRQEAMRERLGFCCK